MIINSLKLLLPALLPAWNFFDVIAPSPRIEFTLLKTEESIPEQWQAFRARPIHLSFKKMLARMFWNPEWNETLFMISCADRIIQNPEQSSIIQHSENEILSRIINDLVCNIPSTEKNKTLSLTASNIQFRLLIVQREGLELTQEVVFESRIIPLTECTLPIGDET